MRGEVFDMTHWRIRGGESLSGSVRVQGAKNAVLPILAASVLTGCETELQNCPRLRDVDASLAILRHLGCRAEWDGDTVYIDSRGVSGYTIPEKLMLQMRSSVIFLGAILGRCGCARLSMPGGCELGPRPVDLHLEAMRALGAHVECVDNVIDCAADGASGLSGATGLTGAVIRLALPSVGATENAMIAACAAKGVTVIENAAREPEIVDLAGYLRALGADIDGDGGPVVTVRGFAPRERVRYRVMPDRIAASTLLCACACAGGDIELTGVTPGHFAAVTDVLGAMGCRITPASDRVRIARSGRMRGGGTVITRPYPGFPTDAQPLLMAASLCADGTTVFVENIFENRFRQAAELRRLGAVIRTEGRVAAVTGVERLRGADVLAEDLRGGAALVTAALGAEGETVVKDPGHIDRGYESLDGTLSRLGAHIEKYMN